MAINWQQLAGLIQRGTSIYGARQSMRNLGNRFGNESLSNLMRGMGVVIGGGRPLINAPDSHFPTASEVMPVTGGTAREYQAIGTVLGPGPEGVGIVPQTVTARFGYLPSVGEARDALLSVAQQSEKYRDKFTPQAAFLTDVVFYSG